MFPNGGICLSAGTNPQFYLKSKPNFIKMGIERTRKPLVSAKNMSERTLVYNVYYNIVFVCLVFYEKNIHSLLRTSAKMNLKI